MIVIMMRMIHQPLSARNVKSVLSSIDKKVF